VPRSSTTDRIPGSTAGICLSPALPRREVAGAQAPLRREPRDAGSNIVTGAPRVIAPESKIFAACDPGARLSRASTSAGHQSGYGREAENRAAAVASECGRAQRESVVAVAIRLAGRNRTAIGRPPPVGLDGCATGPGDSRAASRPSTRSESTTQHGSGRCTPSRLRAIEEVPVARATAATKRRPPETCSAASTTAATRLVASMGGSLAGSRLDGAPELVEETALSQLDLQEPTRIMAFPWPARSGARPGALKPAPASRCDRGSRRLRVMDPAGGSRRPSSGRRVRQDVGVERRWFDTGGKAAPTEGGVAGAGQAGCARSRSGPFDALPPAGGRRGRQAGGVLALAIPHRVRG
jgi:hypothetical protein